MLESQLQILLINKLYELEKNKHNIFFHSIPNEGKRSYNQAKLLKSMGLRKGTPDIHIVKKGISIYVEMKATGKKLRVEQEEIKQKILLSGARHYLVDSIGAINKLIEYIKEL